MRTLLSHGIEERYKVASCASSWAQSMKTLLFHNIEEKYKIGLYASSWGLVDWIVFILKLINISVDTHPQTLSVHLDTESSDL